MKITRLLFGLALLSCSAIIAPAQIIVGGGGTSGGGAACTMANPTATIATAAVNGSASTCMRSDGAPALGTTTGTGSIVRGTSPALSTPTGIVKGDVGLGNVDNTSDTTKNAATVSLTNKTIDGDLNTVQDIATSSLKTPQGNGTKVQLSTGTTTTNNCVKYDANGNTVDAGAACGSGGSVSVTSASPNLVVTPSPGTGTFTIGATYLINAQTGTSYTIVSGDLGKLVTFSNGSAIAVTLPQATGSFAAGASLEVQNKGAGTATITPITSTVNGSATLVLLTNQGCTLVSDGTNWQISACTALGAGTGTVTSAGTSFTGGLISVAGSPVTTTGTAALTVAGTSGGIPYFSGATTWATTAALTANLPVIGGGAGVAPAVGTRSGNTTAYVTTTGTQTSGDCVKIDANGNHIANGSACGGSGAPGGSTTQLQYNNAGAFGGTTGATTSGGAVTFVAPILGTPASGNASNLTNIPVNQATGVLPQANGGFGPNYIANNYYPMLPGMGSSSTTAAFVTTTIRYQPFYVARAITISSLCANVTTASAGGNFQLAIYANSSANQPTGSNLANTGNLSTTTAAPTIVCGTISLAITTPGIYWMGAMVDNTTALFNGVSPNNGSWGSSMVGVANTANLFSSAITFGTTWNTSGGTYGTWPSSPTVTEANNTSSQMIMVAFKVGSVP